MLKRLIPKRLQAVSSRGQVMILFALTLPALIGMMGIGVDVAHIFNARRDIQSATDLAALAGASQLPDESGAATSAAMSIAAENGFSSGVSVTTPYGGDDAAIEVQIDREVDLFFMPVLGWSSIDVSARSVATHEVHAGAAVFAKKDSHCWEGTFTLGGSGITIDGSVHSNGGMTISGSNNTVNGRVTYKDGPPTYPIDGWTNCEPDVHIYGSNPNVEVEAGSWSDWPLFYTRSNFSCTYDIGSTGGDIHDPGPWWVGGSMWASRQLKPGVYCLSGNGYLDLLNADDVTGNVTFVARRMRIEGNNMNLTAYQGGVLFFSDGQNQWPSIRMTPNGGSFEGIIFAEYGAVDVYGGAGFQQTGSIISWAVRLYGGGYSIFGTQDETFGPMRLIE